MGSGLAVNVTGLRQYVRGIKKLDKDLGKVMRKSLNEVAQVVVDKARPRVRRRSGRAAGTVRASSTQTAARIAAGGRRAPYYPWLDWGGRVGRRKSIRRPFIKQGRYIYPALGEAMSEVHEMVGKALRESASSAGLEVE
jgi:hypothetical protein